MMKINSVKDYTSQMDYIDSDIEEKIFNRLEEIKNHKVDKTDILNSLQKDSIDELDFYNLISDEALDYLEEIAEKARKKRIKYFGNNVYLFSPLYIGNHCENHCRYCGFRVGSGIKRTKLTLEEIEEEMIFLRDEHIEDVLILTGESPSSTPVEYIGQAVKLARKYFRVIGLEIHPANIKDYKYLRECGADFVTVFQETYNENAYDFYHPAGNKRSLSYRLNTQERAVLGGMRGVGFGALFGLSDPLEDAFCMAYHANLLQKKYPQTEIAISLPRIRPTVGIDDLKLEKVSEKKLFQIMCAVRIYLPFASITISTRESEAFRNLAVQYAATKISASVDTGIGRRSGEIVDEDEGDEQFEINDQRSVDAIEKDLRKIDMTAVLNDYIDL